MTALAAGSIGKGLTPSSAPTSLPAPRGLIRRQSLRGERPAAKHIDLPLSGRVHLGWRPGHWGRGDAL